MDTKEDAKSVVDRWIDRDAALDTWNSFHIIVGELMYEGIPYLHLEESAKQIASLRCLCHKAPLHMRCDDMCNCGDWGCPGTESTGLGIVQFTSYSGTPDRLPKFESMRLP